MLRHARRCVGLSERARRTSGSVSAVGKTTAVKSGVDSSTTASASSSTRCATIAAAPERDCSPCSSVDIIGFAALHIWRTPPGQSSAARRVRARGGAKRNARVWRTEVCCADERQSEQQPLPRHAGFHGALHRGAALRHLRVRAGGQLHKRRGRAARASRSAPLRRWSRSRPRCGGKSRRGGWRGSGMERSHGLGGRAADDSSAYALLRE